MERIRINNTTPAIASNKWVKRNGNQVGDMKYEKEPNLDNHFKTCENHDGWALFAWLIC